MANTYEVGDAVRIRTAAPFEDAAGTAFDPEVVTFEVRNPAGTTTSYIYGTAANVVKIATGDYACDVDVNTAGNWLYYIKGVNDATPANRGAYQGNFYVRQKQT